ncbi:MAG: threonine synthase, partial [Proteobacteria bacterium]|nr:threonine synthase [Pseudomonadota bacterium]
TGNFGNVFAGYAARNMGLPIKRLLVASNANDILARFFAAGEMRMESVVPTLSPSMDIQVSSNFERLLFDLLDNDGARVEATLREFRKTGHFSVTPETLATARQLFDSARYDDAETQATIRRVHAATGYLLDPHSAVAYAAAMDKPETDGTPMVVLATAHPAKFPDAVEQAAGIRPGLPARLADLLQRPERMSHVGNDLAELEALIDSRRPAKMGAA